MTVGEQVNLHTLSTCIRRCQAWKIIEKHFLMLEQTTFGRPLYACTKSFISALKKFRKRETRLGGVILTLAVFVRRKIWPLSFEIALSLFTAVCCLQSLFPKRSFLFTTFQLEMWHIWDTLNMGKPWLFYTDTRACPCHAISPTLESHAVHSVLFIFPILHSKKLFWRTGKFKYYSCLYIKQKYENNSVHCSQNHYIDTPAHHNGICDRIKP